MQDIDWIVLVATLAFIVIYGVFKTRGRKNVQDYIRGGNESKWWTVGLSVMATQASAITPWFAGDMFRLVLGPQHGNQRPIAQFRNRRFTKDHLVLRITMTENRKLPSLTLVGTAGHPGT